MFPGDIDSVAREERKDEPIDGRIFAAFMSAVVLVWSLYMVAVVGLAVYVAEKVF